MNKTIKEHLKLVANTLPQDVDNITHKHFRTGVEMAESGLTHLISKKEVDPLETYLHGKVEKQQINHYRRLKRAYQKNGMDGVNIYVQKYVDILNSLPKKKKRFWQRFKK